MQEGEGAVRGRVEEDFVRGFEETAVVVCAVELGGGDMRVVREGAEFLTNTTTQIEKKGRWIRRC